MARSRQTDMPRDPRMSSLSMATRGEVTVCESPARLLLSCSVMRRRWDDEMDLHAPSERDALAIYSVVNLSIGNGWSSPSSALFL